MFWDKIKVGDPDFNSDDEAEVDANKPKSSALAQPGKSSKHPNIVG
jgi:hypothetical protein